MDADSEIKALLGSRFDKRRIDSVLNHFKSAAQSLQEGDWENALFKAGKFVEAILKLLWTYAGNTLPRPKDFKATVYAQKIIDQIPPAIISSDGVRVQIPRASIFTYDITSNRGGRHDSDEFNPNEMDAMASLSISSWILAEMIRFAGAGAVVPEDARKMVESIIERRYPTFEEIEGRIYVDEGPNRSAIRCALMILYRKYPQRMSKEELIGAVTRHSYKKSAVKIERLLPYVDIDAIGSIVIRGTGRKKVEEILKANQR